MTLLEQSPVGETLPEHIPVGEIVERSSFRTKTEKGLDYEKRFVSVGDEHSPENAARLNLVIDMWEQFLKLHDEEYPIPLKKNGFKKNPAYEWFYNLEPEEQGTMLEWLPLVLSAKALYPMQRLNDMERVFKSGKVLDRARDILTNSLDAIGIRTRARIMKSIVIEAATESSDRELTIVSLGSGAAVPAIDATLEIEQKLGKKTNMRLFDQSDEILEFAKETAVRDGIDIDRVTTHTGDYYEAFSEVKPESVNIVEALGLWEYLHDSRCVSLLQRSYDLLKPGGVIIVSNMLDDREQLAFNQRGVAWPGVKPRSEQDLMKIVEDAELPTDQIRFTVSDDGVYGILEIHKPWS